MSEQSAVWRNGNEISENRVVRGRWLQENNYGNIGDSQQHQHSTAAAQQQRASDTTTRGEKRNKCPRCRGKNSSSSTMVKIDGISIRDREAAR